MPHCPVSPFPFSDYNYIIDIVTRKFIFFFFSFEKQNWYFTSSEFVCSLQLITYRNTIIIIDYPHPISVPRVSHVFAEAGLLYKLVVIKNKFAASDEVISFRINDQSYSLTGFNQYVIKKMVDNYSYVCILNHCHTCGRA